MGRTLVYRSRNYRSPRRKKTVSPSVYVGPMAFRFVTIAAVAVLLSLYVSTTAKTTQNDALLRHLTEQKQHLTDQLDVLRVEEARNQTATETKKKAEEAGLMQGAKEVQVNKK